MTKKYAYEYGQRWAVRLPRNDLRTFISRFHCAESTDTIKEGTIKICEKGNIPKRLIPQCVRFALAVFNEHQQLYQRVLVGNF